MVAWEHPEPYEGGGWDVAEGVEEEPGSGLEENTVNRSGFEEPGIVTEAEVLAAEVASNKRLLAMMLYLSTGAKSAKEIVGLRVYEARKVKVKKKVRVEKGTGWGPIYDYVEKEVLEEREGYHRLPQSTAYRVLKRLRELGLVKVYRGLDYRKRYYKLTELGQRVAEKLRGMILEKLKHIAEKKDGKHVIRPSRLEELAREMGVEQDLLVEALGLVRVEVGYSEYYALPKKSQW